MLLPDALSLSGWIIQDKEAVGSGEAAFKVDRHYRTEWIEEEEPLLHLDGLTINSVYENLIR